MTENQPNIPLGWNEFNILMTSYKNMIEVNTVVFEQLKKIIEIQQNILTKNDNIFEKEKMTNDTMTEFLETLKDLNETYQEMSDEIKKHNNTLNSESRIFTERFQKHELEIVKNDSRLINKIHIAWGLMGTIVLGLLGLIYTLAQRNSLIENSISILMQIAKKIGVQL